MQDQMVSMEKDINILLEIADEGIKNDLPQESFTVKDNLSGLMTSPIFKEYEIDEKDVKIIAVLFRNLLDGKDEIKSVDILKKIGRGNKIDFLEIRRLNRLKELGILETVGSRSVNTEGIGLFRSSVRLSERFLNKIYNFSGDDKDLPAEEPYKDNLDYLSDQFERIRVLKEIKEIRRNGYYEISADRKRLEEEAKKLEMKVEKRLSTASKVFPFEEFRKKKGLSLKEELIVIAMMRKDVILNEQCVMNDLLDIISRSPYERLVDKNLLQENGRLIKEKIIETGFPTRYPISGGRAETIKLSDNIKRMLLGEKKKQKRERFKENGFFEVVKYSVQFDKVILHPKTSEELSIAIEKIKGSAANILQEWGIKNNLQQSETHKNRRKKAAVTMLFYGPPGTGKTLAANAIAHRLKRELITVDCSKILSKWVGESEQNTRKIFDEYRELSKGKKNHPVLILNEADQFLHKRINATRSTDHMYNQMQNIFLEQVEKFDGILIATTNLMENMDSAFSRRFHHKIEFRRPSAVERLKLWQVHIPEKVPLAKDVNLRWLSEHYDLSGGQISVIVQNAATRAAMRKDKLCQQDFINACETELAGNFDEKAKMRIGFRW